MRYLLTNGDTRIESNDYSVMRNLLRSFDTFGWKFIDQESNKCMYEEFDLPDFDENTPWVYCYRSSSSDNYYIDNLKEIRDRSDDYVEVTRVNKPDVFYSIKCNYSSGSDYIYGYQKSFKTLKELREFVISNSDSINNIKIINHNNQTIYKELEPEYVMTHDKLYILMDYGYFDDYYSCKNYYSDLLAARKYVLDTVIPDREYKCIHLVKEPLNG